MEEDDIKELFERLVEIEEERLEVQRGIVDKLDAIDSRLCSMRAAKS